MKIFNGKNSEARSSRSSELALRGPRIQEREKKEREGLPRGKRLIIPRENQRPRSSHPDDEQTSFGILESSAHQFTERKGAKPGYTDQQGRSDKVAARPPQKVNLDVGLWDNPGELVNFLRVGRQEAGRDTRAPDRERGG